MLVNAETYFGVPVGTMKYANLGIRAEVLLADDHTIVLDKFTHKPQRSGCTALTIGPARREDLIRKVGDGILLPYTQPNFSWEEARMYRRRAKRGSNLIKKKKRSRTISNRLLKYGPNARSTPSPENTYTTTSEMEMIKPTIIDDSSEDFKDGKQTMEQSGSVKSLILPIRDGETHRKATVSLPDVTTTMTANTFPTLITAEVDASQEYPSSTIQPEPSMIVFDKAEKHRSQLQEGRTLHRKLQEDNDKDNSEATRQTGHWDPSFSLPPATDEQVAFLLTNGARLSDYKWIGLYDQCNKKSIPLVWLLDVDPPREEEIGPLIALERNVSSGEVRILNCNTILIPNLYYEADQKHPNTFFFVGVGNVTDIIQRTKARAIGYELDDPLDEHSGDDVMVRLPRGVRTFDLDFLEIYNEDLNSTYGYVTLPSLLVPPCADDV
ncbi:hypothetical protein COOONC_21395 [Cooperia oncophora]